MEASMSCRYEIRFPLNLSHLFLSLFLSFLLSSFLRICPAIPVSHVAALNTPEIRFRGKRVKGRRKLLFMYKSVVMVRSTSVITTRVFIS
ncbi:hypothetical protein F4820DRAFT_294408 [Hypoxylon rubiginosum]|uniref:Uncharacterized protein n=1 Tax=Hypoxylon rubiginosum TaxID=110542 RepID=A0ACB9Z193_9PEZI|nr:hypothetical protein F4820DRAFT_294408 [Hypoxylon rubiginosum]